MILRQLGIIDFVRDSERVVRWTDRIARSSSGQFDTDVLLDAVSTGGHSAFYYCTDDDNPKGIIYSTVVNHLSGNTLTVVGAAGDGAVEDDWADLTTLFNDLAKSLDCVDFEIRGRRGFMRVFKPLGWEEKYTVIGRNCYEGEL